MELLGKQLLLLQLHMIDLRRKKIKNQAQEKIFELKKSLVGIRSQRKKFSMEIQNNYTEEYEDRM